MTTCGWTGTPWRSDTRNAEAEDVAIAKARAALAAARGEG